MPVSYTIKDGYAHCRLVGKYSYEETYNNYKAALDDPLFLSGYKLLIDVFDSEEIRSYEEMCQIAQLLESCPKFGKQCSVLVNPDHAARFGVARMLSSLVEYKEINYSIFYNLNDAIIHLRD